MDKKSTNPCTRCGKERIVSKTWKEKVVNFMGTSYIVYTENVCPDKECQKIVQEKLDASKQKKDEMDADRAERMKLKSGNRKNTSIKL